MKLWILTTEYPPDSGGGISTYCFHTGQMFRARGHQVTFFIPISSRASVKEEDGITLVRFQPATHHHAYLGDETALSYSFAQVLEEHARVHGPPDYIESQEYIGISYFLLQKKRLLDPVFSKTIIYLTAHAPGFLYLDYNQAPAYQIPSFWVNEMEKSVLQSANGVISPSAYLLRQIDRYIFWDNQEKAVIHNPFQPFEEIRPEYTPNDIVFFGKLTRQKGCLELLKYFKRLWDEGCSHALRLIGGGDHFFYPVMMDMQEYLKKDYKKYIEKGLLIFEGHITPDKLTNRLANAHVVLVPSLVDNLPYTVLEAMALGKIVLASDQGGHAEIIEDGVSGFIFSHDNSGDSFSSKLQEILSLDPEVIRKVGARARNRVFDTCSYETIYTQKMKFLNSLSPANGSEFPYIRPRSKEEIPGKRRETPGLLSVVIPYYNMSAYIMDTLDSIRASTYSPIEILLINDGSDDLVKVEENIKKRKGIRIIHKPNEGLAAARNTGATEAQGEFMAFLDADDKIHPEYYSKAIRVIKQYSNVSFVGCWAEYFEDSSISWPSFNPEPPYLLVHNMINSSALVYRRADFLSSGLNDTQFEYGMEDYESVMHLVSNGFGGVAIPEKLWYYRIRTGSMARSFNEFSRTYLYRLLSQKHAHFYAEFATEVADLLNANGPGYLIENPTRITRKPFPFMTPDMVSFIKRHRVLRNIAARIYSRLRK
jgi:glycosyltransferase involved in cell wall biosynthesis